MTARLPLLVLFASLALIVSPWRTASAQPQSQPSQGQSSQDQSSRGQAATAGSADAPAMAASESYVLGTDDVVEIDVLGRSDFHTRAQVGQDGMIQLPLIGAFSATNKTKKQLADSLAQALEQGGYYSHPILSVEVVAFASKYVTVLGAVAQPGLVSMNKPYHVSEILARVGGLRENAADYLVLRSPSGGERKLSVNDLATGDASQDPIVASGDKIFAPSAQIFYVSGQVKSPGGFAVSAGMTFRMAIARAGGLTDIGTDHDIKVTRDGKKIGRVDLDSQVMPGDVVVIGEKLF